MFLIPKKQQKLSTDSNDEKVRGSSVVQRIVTLSHNVGNGLRKHWLITLLTTLTAVPIFYSLGQNFLWADEGDTAVLASAIIKTGLPKAWDGTTFTDSDFGQRVNESLVMVSTPWLQYYLTAISMFVFGENTWAARLPFALAALATIPLLYCTILAFRGSLQIAITASFLLSTSVQFLLYARQCRYPPLGMALTLLQIMAFKNLLKPRGILWFALWSILLFHSHPLPAVATLGCFAMFTPFLRSFAVYRKRFWISALIVSVFTLPWFPLAKAGWDQNTAVLRNGAAIINRAIQYLIEWLSVAPLIGWLILVILIIARFRQTNGRRGKEKRKIKDAGSTDPIASPTVLSLIAFAITIALGALMVYAESSANMFVVGMRYCSPAIPLSALISAVLVCKATQGSKGFFAAAVAVLAFTQLGNSSLIWLTFKNDLLFGEKPEYVKLHTANTNVHKVLKIGLFEHLSGLGKHNPGTVDGVSTFLNANGNREDLVITNYEWEPVYFHTGMPQAFKIIPMSEKYTRIHEIVQKHNLPSYVYDVKGARWLVWRWPWDGYRGYSWKTLTEYLKYRGATLTKVASVPETGWENRANKHFHRFPDTGVLYNSEVSHRDTEIYRIDWGL